MRHTLQLRRAPNFFERRKVSFVSGQPTVDSTSCISKCGRRSTALSKSFGPLRRLCRRPRAPVARGIEGSAGAPGGTGSGLRHDRRSLARRRTASSLRTSRRVTVALSVTDSAPHLGQRLGNHTGAAFSHRTADRGTFRDGPSPHVRASRFRPQDADHMSTDPRPVLISISGRDTQVRRDLAP
jgi:hypothetical protein